MPNFIEKKYLDPKNANNKKKILPCNFNQEMLVTFGEKLLIFHIHKTKLIFALFAKKILAGGKNIKQSLPYQKKLNGQSLIRYITGIQEITCLTIILLNKLANIESLISKYEIKKKVL